MSSWTVGAVAECSHRSWKWANPNHRPLTGSCAAGLAQVSIKKTWAFLTFFLSRMLKARKFNTYIYYFTKSQIFLIPFSPVGKREARSSWTSLSVPMVPYSSQNTTSPAWWSAHLHFSWFQVSFNTQTQTLVCWTAHPGGTDIFFDLLHHSLPSHLK